MRSSLGALGFQNGIEESCGFSGGGLGRRGEGAETPVCCTTQPRLRTSLSFFISGAELLRWCITQNKEGTASAEWGGDLGREGRQRWPQLSVLGPQVL